MESFATIGSTLDALRTDALLHDNGLRPFMNFSIVQNIHTSSPIDVGAVEAAERAVDRARATESVLKLPLRANR